MQLKDQAAIVTGGASGLGAATARKLAAQGAKVAVFDLNAKLAESLAAEIKGVAVVCDVSDAASAEVTNSFDNVRVEACDSCKGYIKSVDLTKNGRAVPVVDELATVALNIWAEEHGYAKIESNLLGL